jgi:aerobic-type carbon monoxide dehydrogenase small subunit (CoxS/CutS family)
MSEIKLRVNDREITVKENTVLAAALANAGIAVFRQSVQGEPRAFLCGMGICYECRVTVNGAPNRLSCQVLCENGMEITTPEAALQNGEAGRE